MSGSPFLNQLSKVEHENDLLRDAYEECVARLDAMTTMRDELKAQFIKAMEENLELIKAIKENLELRKEDK